MPHNERKSLIEYYFLKRSIEQFSEDLDKAEKVIKDRILPKEESTDIIYNLVCIKERIESFEKYL